MHGPLLAILIVKGCFVLHWSYGYIVVHYEFSGLFCTCACLLPWTWICHQSFSIDLGQYLSIKNSTWCYPSVSWFVGLKIESWVNLSCAKVEMNCHSKNPFWNRICMKMQKSFGIVIIFDFKCDLAVVLVWQTPLGGQGQEYFNIPIEATERFLGPSRP